MKWSGALLGLIFLAGCSAGGDAPRPGTAQKAAQNIAYSKDPRTGLCYASVGSETYGGAEVVSITNVPCSPEVEKLLGQ